MRIRSFFVSVFVSACLTCMSAPRYIFYFIGDGMGHGAVSLAQLYNRTVLGNATPLTMLQMPAVSMAFTHSASSPVTDSAAAGTALSTGNKTANGMLGVTPDTTAVTSIAKVLFDNGYGVGLVTTVAPDDATPAAFYAHQPSRGMFYEIGCDAARSGYDFLAGANLRGVRDGKGVATDLLARFERSGVAVVRGVDELKKADSRRVLLLNTDTVHSNDVGYAIDSLDNVLSLQVMTQACLNHLQKYKPEKFFMMVEGGSIDHAAHSNDAAAVAIETLDFDRALAIAYDFYNKYPDETLIVVTADHETGGLMLGNNELHYYVKPDLLKYSRMSTVRFADKCREMQRDGRMCTWAEMRQLLTDNMGLFGAVTVSAADETSLMEKFEAMKSACDDNRAFGKALRLFSSEVFGLVSKMSGLGWTTGFHTGTPVPVFAVGAGADAFTGVMDNTEIPRKIIGIAGYSL